MAVLSRMTGAAAYKIDRNMGETEAEETALSLLEDKDVLHITMVPEEEWMDGSDVNARLMFLKDGVVSGLELHLTMPFQPETAAKEDFTEAVITEAPMVTPEQLPMEKESQEAEKPATEKPATALLTAAIGIMLGVLLLLVSGYAAVLKLMERKRSQEQEGDYEKPEKQCSGMEESTTGNLRGQDWEQYGDSDTQLLRSDDEEGDNRTTVLFGEEETYEMMLTDQNNPAKFFSFPLRDSVIIGRSARSSQIVLDYDASVSGRHCEIENRGGRFFVRDLQSSNGTKVNGIKVLSETELLIGNLLKLGQVEMKVGWSTHE